MATQTKRETYGPAAYAERYGQHAEDRAALISAGRKIPALSAEAFLAAKVDACRASAAELVELDRLAPVE
jgi:hypothetical protein